MAVAVLLVPEAQIVSASSTQSVHDRTGRRASRSSAGRYSFVIVSYQGALAPGRPRLMSQLHGRAWSARLISRSCRHSAENGIGAAVTGSCAALPRSVGSARAPLPDHGRSRPPAPSAVPSVPKNWRRVDKSGVGAETAKNFELRGADPRQGTVLRWQRALEKADVKFPRSDRRRRGRAVHDRQGEALRTVHKWAPRA